MANVEKLSVALTPELAEIIRQCVKDGDYASSSEVIREALRDWNIKRQLQQDERMELRRLWQEGLNSGAGRFSSMEELKAAAREQLLKNTD